MTTPKTPSLNAQGVYTLSAPYNTLVQANVLYTCKAIRAFADLVDLGVDILASYYTPVGLTQTALDADKAAGANIITLMSANAPTIHVPDTYIAAFPAMDNVAYSTIVMALSLGPLPDTLDLTFAKTQLADAASSVIGVTPTVTVFSLPSTGVMTTAQSATAETARQAAITNRTTDYAKLLALQTQYTALQQQYAVLQALCISKNVVTPA